MLNETGRHAHYTLIHASQSNSEAYLAARCPDPISRCDLSSDLPCPTTTADSASPEPAPEVSVSGNNTFPRQKRPSESRAGADEEAGPGSGPPPPPPLTDLAAPPPPRRSTSESEEEQRPRSPGTRRVPRRVQPVCWSVWVTSHRPRHRARSSSVWRLVVFWLTIGSPPTHPALVVTAVRCPSFPFAVWFVSST